MSHCLIFSFALAQARSHAERSCYGGKYSRQSLKDEFPSFVFHNVKELKPLPCPSDIPSPLGAGN